MLIDFKPKLKKIEKLTALRHKTAQYQHKGKFILFMNYEAYNISIKEIQ